MSNQPTKKIPEAGRNAANALSAHTLKVARPFFWHIGARNRGVPRGASAFILRFDQYYVAVTANHVIESYLIDLAADSRTVCQLGQCQVWPEKTLIARSEKLDIATFSINPALLGVIGADVLDCRGQWPPPKVEVGDTLTLTGFLDNHRTRLPSLLSTVVKVYTDLFVARKSILTPTRFLKVEEWGGVPRLPKDENYCQYRQSVSVVGRIEIALAGLNGDLQENASWMREAKSHVSL